MTGPAAIEAWIDGVGLLGPGLADWAQGAALLRGAQVHAPAPTQLPVPTLLPPAERRRASRVVKAALAVGLQACEMAGVDPATLPNVFASSGGDGHNCHALCELLATPERHISPTRFHNSVHNAASGYWSIATGATAAAQVVAAYDASLAAGLLEAMTQLAVTGEAVLLVAADSEYPPPLHAKRPIQDASGLALVLAPARGDRSIGVLRLPRRGTLLDAAPPGPPAAGWVEAMASMPPLRGLPLLAALLGPGARTVALPWLPPQLLQLEVEPA